MDDKDKEAFKRIEELAPPPRGLELNITGDRITQLDASRLAIRTMDRSLPVAQATRYKDQLYPKLDRTDKDHVAEYLAEQQDRLRMLPLEVLGNTLGCPGQTIAEVPVLCDWHGVFERSFALPPERAPRTWKPLLKDAIRLARAFKRLRITIQVCRLSTSDPLVELRIESGYVVVSKARERLVLNSCEHVDVTPDFIRSGVNLITSTPSPDDSWIEKDLEPPPLFVQKAEGLALDIEYEPRDGTLMVDDGSGDSVNLSREQIKYLYDNFDNYVRRHRRRLESQKKVDQYLKVLESDARYQLIDLLVDGVRLDEAFDVVLDDMFGECDDTSDGQDN